MNEQGDSGIEIAHIFFQDKVLFRLRRNLCLEFAEVFLDCRSQYCREKKREKEKKKIPFDSSSDISKSLSLADMDRYRAVTDRRFDARAERASCDDMVFCRETGWNEDEDDVEALDAGCSMVATDICWSVETVNSQQSTGQLEVNRSTGQQEVNRRSTARGGFVCAMSTVSHQARRINI